MWRVAFRFRPGNLSAFAWQAVQCWPLRKQQAFNIVKVERKNSRRKRVIIVSPWAIEKGSYESPRDLLDATLDFIPDAEKLRHIREGLI